MCYKRIMCIKEQIINQRALYSVNIKHNFTNLYQSKTALFYVSQYCSTIYPSGVENTYTSKRKKREEYYNSSFG